MRRPPPRVALATAAAVAGALLIAAPALAAPSRVTWPSSINVKAAPGTENYVDITYELESGSWTHFVNDRAGVTTVVTQPPSCYPRGPKRVHCPDGTSGDDGTPGGGETFSISLGDGDDHFWAFSVGEFRLRAGSGDDFVVGNDDPSVMPAMEDEPQVTFYSEDALYGDGGDDHLGGRRGPDFLYGGPGNDFLNGGEAAPDDFGGETDDSLLGGPGNDRLRAVDGYRDLVIDCGKGRRDKAWIDRKIDPKPKGCEWVKRVRPR